MCILRCHVCICNKRQAQGIRTIQNSSEKAGGFHEIYSHLTPWESPPCHATIRMNCRGSPSIPTSTHVSSSVGYGFNNVPTCLFSWGSYMIYSGSWSPQLQLPRLSLWMSQRASPCRGWLSKTITTWLWPTEALKLVVQHETHHVSSCFNPSPKYQQYPTVSNSQYVRWVHGDDHPISRRWTHTHTFETTTSQMWSLVEHLGKSVSYGGKLQKVRNLQRNIGPIHHQEPRYSNRCKKMK